jgi:hypothetical protein
MQPALTIPFAIKEDALAAQLVVMVITAIQTATDV